MRRVTAALLFAAAIGQFGVSATEAVAQPRPATDVRAQRRATAESIAAQYAAEQFRANRIGDERTLKLLNENEANRRRIAAILRDAKASAAQRDAAREQLKLLDAQLAEVNGKLLASEQTGEELRAQLREYQRQITDAVESASPEVAAAYELYAAGDRDTAYEIIERLSQVEAAAAKRAGEIRAGALMRRPANLALDRRDRGEMTLAQVIVAWERAQAADQSYHEGWVDLTSLYIEAGRLVDAKKAAEQGLANATTDTERGRMGGLLGEVLLTAGDARGADTIWDKALVQLKAAYAADPKDRSAARGVMAILDRIGDLRTAELDYSRAALVYREELDLCRRLASETPEDIRSQRDLVICLSKMGDANLHARNFPAAKVNFEEMLALTRKVLATQPDNTGFQRENGMALMKMGELYTRAQQPLLAQPPLDEAQVILRRLAALDTTSAIAQRDLSVALEFRARAQETRTPAGLKAYRKLMEEALQIRRQMAAADPTNVQILRDLGYGLDDYAERHIEFALRGKAPAELAPARRALEEALVLHRKIAASPTATGYDQRQVGTILGQLALVVQTSGDPAAAKPIWDEMLAVRRKMVEQNPSASIAFRDLGGALLDYARVYRDAKDWQGALPLIREGVTHMEKAHALAPNDVNITFDLAVATKLWGDVAYEVRDSDTVRSAYVRSAALSHEVLEARPDDPAAHRQFWGVLYVWASMTDDVEAWEAAIKSMEATDAKGLLAADDKGYLTEARKALKAAQAEAARPAAATGARP